MEMAAREYWKNKEDESEEVGINKVQLTNAWYWYYRDAVAGLLKVAVE